MAVGQVRWVLLAEDDEEIRQLIRDSLIEEAGDLNLQIVEARDGVEAISLASYREFHCVVTDLKMPRASGEELLKSLHSYSINANTPTLVVSGHASPEFTLRYDNVKLISKPFVPSDVAQAVIEEIRLGRLDERPAAGLMHPFVMALTTFCEEKLKTKCKLDSAVEKSVGASLHGDVHCQFTITTGVARSSFCLSFDRTFIDRTLPHLMSQSDLSWANVPSETAARHLCLALFELVRPAIAARTGQNPNATNIHVFCNERDRQYLDLVNVGGVYTMVHTEFGRICAGAYAKPAKSRLKAA